ncbi:MAG TPA: UDP-N-acetylglucosamine--N-acetylmuramyl-(pentapeptide) pyrophosphoryl-undecaprenol N-acetylglucosamine transferase, partial [Bacillales bacterium]|nr:UDP-N-acetylglucosamine--N-acetylmuramyl-(pentapeptide) pyrophosphoryl-undecaprenol N-acetylglucosamine transferase [Bacillales bacterium]
MNILLSGGGTGGHIYPALALMREIKKIEGDSRFLYIGSERGLEKDIISREGIDFQPIEISGFRRTWTLENVRTVMRFLKGVAESKKAIKNFQPDVVVGTGGYVCGPVVYAAAKLKIPTVIHEQNSVPGLTNKFLSRYVNKVAISLASSRAYFPGEKVVYIGNPRASEVIGVDGAKGRASVNLKPGKKSVLLFGGSRGAEPINNAFLDALPEAGRSDYQFVYVTGNVHYDTVMEKVERHG